MLESSLLDFVKCVTINFSIYVGLFLILFTHITVIMTTRQLALLSVDQFPEERTGPRSFQRCPICTGIETATKSVEDTFEFSVDSERQHSSTWCV